jgi:hypothetical protein
MSLLSLFYRYHSWADLSWQDDPFKLSIIFSFLRTTKLETAGVCVRLLRNRYRYIQNASQSPGIQKGFPTC